jgi:2,3-bisphosphoglycerate-dependent phosphoglycerate mutase
MKLFLIRHAQSQNNARPESERVEDPVLTEIGHEQARRLSEWLPSLGLTRLFTSPFRRTLETTVRIHHATGLVPEVITDLHEQGGCYAGHTIGSMIGRPGMTGAEIEKEFPGFRIAEDIDAEGWWKCKPYERFEPASQRAWALLQWTQKQFAHTEERVAYVSHGDLKMRFLEHFHPQTLTIPDNTSVTTIRVTPDSIQLTDYNRTEHLPADLVTH